MNVCFSGFLTTLEQNCLFVSFGLGKRFEDVIRTFGKHKQLTSFLRLINQLSKECCIDKQQLK